MTFARGAKRDTLGSDADPRRSLGSACGPPPAARRAADVLLGVLAASISLSTTGMQAAVAALGGLTAASLVAGWRVVRRTPLDVVILAFFGTLALSTLASGRPLEAGGWSRPWVALAYFAVYWWLRDRVHAVRFVRVLVAAAALTAVYGIVQHYTGADWYRSLTGREIQVRLREPGASGFAVVGFFANYLTFAHTMLFPLGWAVAMALRGAWLGIVAAPLLVIAIVFSTARGVWLALAVVAGALALLGVRAGAMVRPRHAGLMLGGLLVAGAAAFASAPELRAHATNMFATVGPNRARLAIYRANLDIVREHPVLGLGFGRYREAAKPFYAAHPEADRRSHAHNNYLQIAAEAGLAGLAAFCLLYAAALRLGWDALAHAPDAGTWVTAAGAWLGILAFLVGGLTQYSFGDNEVALAMWVALAVLVRCREP
jgi:O-antigen ligase